MWCWRRLLRVPWTARSNQSILMEINNGYSLEGLILKLKLQFGHLIQRDNSLEKTLMVGKIQEKGATEGEMAGCYHQLNGHKFAQTLGDTKGQGSLACYSPWGRRIRHNLATEQQQRWWAHGSTSQSMKRLVDVQIVGAQMWHRSLICTHRGSNVSPNTCMHNLMYCV